MQAVRFGGKSHEKFTHCCINTMQTPIELDYSMKYYNANSKIFRSRSIFQMISHLVNRSDFPAERNDLEETLQDFSFPISRSLYKISARRLLHTFSFIFMVFIFF